MKIPQKEVAVERARNLTPEVEVRATPLFDPDSEGQYTISLSFVGNVGRGVGLSVGGAVGCRKHYLMKIVSDIPNEY